MIFGKEGGRGERKEKDLDDGKSCVKCPPNFGSDDGTKCTFSGKFELLSKENNKTIKFDLTPLKNQ